MRFNNMLSRRESDSFYSLCRDADKYKVMSAEQEAEAFARLLSGDKTARDDIFNANIPFAISMATKFFGSKLALEDLVQEAFIGMLTAIDKFDPTRNVRFVSYARWYIRQRMQQATLMTAFSVSLPNRDWVGVAKALKAETVIVETASPGTCPRPSAADVASAAGVTESVAEMAEIMRYGVNSLDDTARAKMGPGGDDSTGEDFSVIGLLKYSTPPNQEELIDDMSIKKLYRLVMDTMSPKEVETLELSYGIDGTPGSTCARAATEFGVTKQAIHHRVKRVKDRLTADVGLCRAAKEVFEQ